MLSFLELDFEFVFEQVEMIDRIYIKNNALKSMKRKLHKILRDYIKRKKCTGIIQQVC